MFVSIAILQENTVIAIASWNFHNRRQMLWDNAVTFARWQYHVLERRTMFDVHGTAR